MRAMVEGDAMQDAERDNEPPAATLPPPLLMPLRQEPADTNYDDASILLLLPLSSSDDRTRQCRLSLRQLATIRRRDNATMPFIRL